MWEQPLLEFGSEGELLVRLINRGRILKIEPVALGFSNDGAVINAHEFGCLSGVAPLGHGLFDDLPLDGFFCQLQIQSAFKLKGVAGMKVFSGDGGRQVLYREDVGVGGDNKPLDQIMEFAHISRPIVRLQD